MTKQWYDHDRLNFFYFGQVVDAWYELFSVLHLVEEDHFVKLISLARQSARIRVDVPRA